MKTLILGGVRSGKSRLAERAATKKNVPVIYIATAKALDGEMKMRIENHRAHRPPNWMVIEESLHLAQRLQENSRAGNCILVDCLTMWLTNLLLADDKAVLEQERSALLGTIPSISGEIIMVSNETNMGVTPVSELSRRYCDEAGKLHQLLAQICDRVVLMIAGLPQVLKGKSL